MFGMYCHNPQGNAGTPLAARGLPLETKVISRQMVMKEKWEKMELLWHQLGTPKKVFYKQVLSLGAEVNTAVVKDLDAERAEFLKEKVVTFGWIITNVQQRLTGIHSSPSLA